ncbi:MAG: hypothetical protein KDK91_17300 [Gammaproteobacteria bacterium]|nr:hypothetical protein [Gammaproteobacteria bacterium]
MKLIVLARDRYEDYFRRGLLEAAERDGVDVRFIGFRRSERRIDLVRSGTVVQTLPLNAAPRAIVGFARAGRDDDSTIVLNSAGYNWFWQVLYLRYAIPRASLVFDVYDWLFYDARFPKLHVMRCIDWVYRRVCDGMIVVSPELLHHYPGAFLLDNASNVEGNVGDKRSKSGVAVVASIDGRMDFALLERVVDLLPQVTFHFHGWVQAQLPGIEDRFRALRKRVNVEYHGPYVNEELETLLATYRIGLLPYATGNRINRYVNPEKIYHYLRMGMEVVATPIPQAQRMGNYVHLASTAAEFASTISALLSGEAGKHPGPLGSRFHWSERWPTLRRFLVTVAGR